MIFGSFLSNIDMQSGSPTFGTPESGIGLLCTGQIARHFGLPFRTGGGLTSSQVPDAQAGYEALMTLLPTFLAGANWVMHSAGWLEGGLVAGYEKFVIDVELLQMLQARVHPAGDRRGRRWPSAPTRRSATAATSSAPMHTMERFRTCFYRPMLSSSENYERWMRNGGHGHRRPGRRRSTREARGVRAAAARRRDPRRSSRSTSSVAAPSSATDDSGPAVTTSANAGSPPATSCSPSTAPTGPGIVHAVSGFLVEHGGNILESQQFGDRDTGRFFMRIDFAIADPAPTPTSLRADFAAVADAVRHDLRAVGGRRRRTAR